MYGWDWGERERIQRRDREEDEIRKKRDRDGELLSGLGGEENCADVETKINPAETTQAQLSGIAGHGTDLRTILQWKTRLLPKLPTGNDFSFRAGVIIFYGCCREWMFAPPAPPPTRCHR